MVTVHSDMVMASGAWIALNSGTGLINLKIKQIELHDRRTMMLLTKQQLRGSVRTENAHADIRP